MIIFLYKSCVLTWKMGSSTNSERLTIGQNCSVVCTNKGGHRDTFSSKRHKAPRILIGLGHRALSEARGEVRMSPLHGEFDQLLLACSKGVVYAMIA